ncbi:unnamed protein product, partial [Mesorhabditis belari]|uniref:Uncharacterized protein n=1 Tax=Mesorhabditis belari TaxID=2138241 RepID=A0AAF3ETZ9_9BILA
MLMTIPRIPARNPIKERLRRLRILAIAANLRGRIRFKKNRDKKLICERKVSSRALIAPISVHDLFPNDLLLPREPVRSSTSLRELLVATSPHLIKSLSSNDPFHEELYEKKPRISRSVTSRDWTPKPAFDAKDKSNSIATAKQDNNIKTLWKLDALAHMFANKNQLANLNNGPAWKSLGKCCTRGCDVSQDEKPINGQMNDVSPVTPIKTLISNVKSEVVTSVACLSPIRPVYSPPTVSDESSVFEEHIPVTLLPRDSMEFVTPNRRLRYQYADSFTDDVQGKILAPLCEFDGCETIGGTTCDSEIKVVVKTPRSETSLNNNTSYDSNVVSDAFSSFSRIQDDEPLIEDTVSDRRER